MSKVNTIIDPTSRCAVGEINNKIGNALVSDPHEILSVKYGISIRRRDIHTVLDVNWLNDEIIYFYLILLIDRINMNILVCMQ